jgi:hypothetical protein
MLVDNKHTSLYWKGEQIPVGVTDIEDEAAEFYAKRGLVNIVGEPKQLEVATPKKRKKRTPKEDTDSVDKAE